MKKQIVTSLIGIVITIGVAVGYFYLLDLLLSPYQYRLDKTIEAMDARDAAAANIGGSLPVAERDALLKLQFGDLPARSEIHVQKQVAKGWIRICVIGFSLFALGTLIHFRFFSSPNLKGRVLLHVLALPAFAFSFPILFFNDDALRLIKPAGAACSSVFFLAVLIVSKLKKRANP